MSKILIAIPCMDQVPTPFAQSLAMIRKGEHECGVAFQMGSLIYTSRNNLALTAIQGEYDWILWLDSDMVFQQDVLQRMMQVAEEHDLDFLSGLYFRRVPPFTPVMFKTLEKAEHGATWTEFEELPKELFEVAGCGFGLCLTKVDMIFDIQAKHETLFTPFFGLGEDLAFCWRARQMGYKIYCDPTIEAGHVGYSVIGRSFYESYRNAHPKEATDEI